MQRDGIPLMTCTQSPQTSSSNLRLIFGLLFLDIGAAALYLLGDHATDASHQALFRCGKPLQTFEEPQAPHHAPPFFGTEATAQLCPLVLSQAIGTFIRAILILGLPFSLWAGQAFNFLLKLPDSAKVPSPFRLMLFLLTFQLLRPGHIIDHSAERLHQGGQVLASGYLGNHLERRNGLMF